MSKATVSVSKEKLIEDLRVVVADAEELLKATAGQAGEKAAVVREKVQESLKRAKAQLEETEEYVIAKAKEAAGTAEDFVEENPWKSVGIAAGLGLVIGLLISRR